MPENLLTLLNYLLIALLYLFFARVLWAVWSEVRAAKPKAPTPTPVPVPVPPAPPPPRAATEKKDKRAKARAASGPPTRLVVTEPPERAGITYGLGQEMTVGRAAGCHVGLAGDSFASNLHARIYQADGLTFVEDLGSTNGTFVNGARISGPTAVKPGDRVRVGATVLEVG